MEKVRMEGSIGRSCFLPFDSPRKKKRKGKKRKEKKTATPEKGQEGTGFNTRFFRKFRERIG